MKSECNAKFLYNYILNYHTFLDNSRNQLLFLVFCSSYTLDFSKNCFAKIWSSSWS